MCFYQWVEKRGKRINYSKAYKDWLLGRRTLAEICNNLDVSYPKLNKEFDKFDISDGLQDKALKDINKPINLLIDATFFGREFGFLVFHDCQKVVYFKEIKTESIKDFKEGIRALKQANIGINSIIIDGKRGYINNIKKLLGNIPIQMYLQIYISYLRNLYFSTKKRSFKDISLTTLNQVLARI